MSKFVNNFGGKIAAAAIVGILGGYSLGAFVSYMCLTYLCKKEEKKPVIKTKSNFKSSGVVQKIEIVDKKMYEQVETPISIRSSYVSRSKTPENYPYPSARSSIIGPVPAASDID